MFRFCGKMLPGTVVKSSGLAALAQYQYLQIHTFRDVLTHLLTLLRGDVAPESGAEALVGQEWLAWNVAATPSVAAILKLHAHVDCRQ